MLQVDFRETENSEKEPEPRKSERSKKLSKRLQEMLQVLQENEKEKMTHIAEREKGPRVTLGERKREEAKFK